jgi:predicted DCC family thiol-disulfide oxidoreductase YuxK
MERDAKAVLLYAGRCPKCRFLSAVVVALSLGTLSRMPLEREEVEQFYLRDHPEARGDPVLVERDRFTYGRRVFFAVPRLIAQTWWTAFRALFRARREAHR